MTHDLPPYQPISCALHSDYELAIMQGKTLSLRYLDSNNLWQQIKALPVDVVTQNGAEYLLLEHNRQQLKIRLDRISHE